MSALTSNRNTTEILCHAQKFHRIILNDINICDFKKV